MSRNYKFRNPEVLYLVSFATVFWIDVFVRLVGTAQSIIGSQAEGTMHTVNGSKQSFFDRIMTSALEIIKQIPLQFCDVLQAISGSIDKHKQITAVTSKS